MMVKPPVVSILGGSQWLIMRKPQIMTIIVFLMLDSTVNHSEELSISDVPQKLRSSMKI